MELTSEEKKISQELDSLLKNFKLKFGDSQHIELAAVLDLLGHDEKFLKMKIEASKGQEEYRAKVFKSKQTAVYILKNLHQNEGAKV